ncbi:zinc finger domain-containing protein [Purpureocillium lavendulum]|uniref:Box C/D snoRNA protein 1 n=1 Tax=Purpureocillium lavendulum TaxID=1247861 RepID=A0AB34FRG8_9HYPO|nr:zinc finger domain-containing protein [Purpureocillium lavendulum]
MADPLLTSLCSICHVSAPKYKCPRCGIQTCSVQCIKKHKAWSDCSGERDPTAYVPPSQLRTVAGVDHDYNFLHGLGMSMERAERVLVDDKKIVRGEDLRPAKTAVRMQAKWTTTRDGRKRKTYVPRQQQQPQAGDASNRRFERHLAHRLRQLNVHIECAPVGMTRQRENNTTFNRRTGTVNWQVEWLVLEGEQPAHDGTRATPARMLSKVLEDVPLYRAYHDARNEKARAESGRAKRTTKDDPTSETQDASTSTWNHSAYSVQDPSSGRWSHRRNTAAEKPAEPKPHEFQFYLGGPPARSDLPRTVTSLEFEDCLKNILADTTVREFPTLYVLESGKALPAGFVLGPKEAAPSPQGQKRASGQEGGDQGSSKRQKQDDMEQGELGEESEEGEAQDDDMVDGGPGSDGDDAAAIDDIGEEEGEEGVEDDSDDSTSSSGSDSDFE